VRSTIDIESSPTVLIVLFKKWKGHLVLLRTMSDMFSLDNMLNSFVEGEGEDEPSPREQKISERVEEEKNFCYLKFNKGLSNNILYVMCDNQNTHTHQN
jgi:hypothetical protein